MKPEIAIVFFGWNDVADTAGAPDSSFRPPNLANAHFQRFLLRYKSYRVLLNWLRSPPSPTADLRRRVSIAEYVGNLTRFRDVSLETSSQPCRNDTTASRHGRWPSSAGPELASPRASL